MTSLLTVAGVSFLALAVAHHWLMLLTAGSLHQLWRYVAGVSLIILLYGAWCYAQPGALRPGWALSGLLATSIGAGGGTMAGYLVDHYAALRRRARYGEGCRESGARVAGED